MAREWLYRIYLEIPGNRVIADLVRTVVHAVLIHDHETECISFLGVCYAAGFFLCWFRRAGYERSKVACKSSFGV
jgi:hypothetical protein